jgi:hypothetical protein
MNTRLLAQVLTSLMLVYFFLINHVRLSRFNNITRLGTQWRSTAVGLIPGILIIATLASSNELKAVLGAGWLWLWFALQIRQWWVPYLLGQTALHAISAGTSLAATTRQSDFCPRGSADPAPIFST